jgi:hypothetical protein
MVTKVVTENKIFDKDIRTKAMFPKTVLNKLVPLANTSVSE